MVEDLAQLDPRAEIQRAAFVSAAEDRETYGQAKMGANQGGLEEAQRGTKEGDTVKYQAGNIKDQIVKELFSGIDKKTGNDHCSGCAHVAYHSGQGECWHECGHPEFKGGAYDNILWGCYESELKKITPSWCPLGLGGR